MSPALNGSLAIQRFERSDAIEIRDGITFDFYTGLSHILSIHTTLYALHYGNLVPDLRYTVSTHAGVSYS